ncbi:phosphodiesterase (plasmid) [Rhizobium leguminosarum]|jgi:diguanylate cyclase (GGDEF)-like protein|uniref:putative bifunctional diguanylate cyclase/phosphodiesterase n=1 Tax=Rhizobium leguminosarum TaxID=384 RepID=UPI00102F32B5|nr:GGDEF domain-containing phosphodiesterase [Rhizobium leguminosarum]MBP2491592.1 diguanylate cyclase (GGDEF)-like protein [Rhizobium leguminosarum]NKJ95107.1 EAL domain-containing protein [Rhizobium leguminosarum bv. viciae]QIO75048.1 EAL domain-containing protein [Rhizobium leguminosarum bv. trifolii]QIO82063.1 EAL domain-containing protein [Rhizobium leguminosarum bv. trifolii]TAU91720.1 phosphodiesterase [Rhizobium leguminosarum]
MAYFSTYFRWLSVQRFCRTAAYANVQRDESTASFSFAEALKSLKTENDAVRGRSSRHGLWIAVAVYVSFALPDRWLIPDVAPVTIAARFVVATIALLVFETLRLAKAQTVWLDVTCASALLAGYVGWLYPAIATRDVTAMSYYMIFGAIFMMGANLFFSFPFRLSVITSSLVLCAFFVTIEEFFPSSQTYKFAFGLFYISCFIFTSFVNWRLNVERRNVLLNAAEARHQHWEASERGRSLLELSHTDYLTGISNRRALDRRLDECWAAWKDERRDFSVFLIDVDFFKRFNDRYGHQEGDRCLTVIANALKAVVESSDGMIGRYGGEEFIVVMPDALPRVAMTLAEKIRMEVESLAIAHDERPDDMSIVTVSIGAAFTREKVGEKVERIVREADLALYNAKASGRNCIRSFDPLLPRPDDYAGKLVPLLAAAIDRKLVSLVYQPIFDVTNEKARAVEALMRLRMPDGTAVSPKTFIPVAERSGAILELGRWAIETACRDILMTDRMATVSVNVSPIQLRSPGFAASVADILARCGVCGSRLALEVTEGLDMDMQSEVLKCIADLRALGVEIWLDDFGCGFAGLSWLRAIEFQTVKVDRTFLHDCSNPRGLMMLQDMIALIRNRGNTILVEGVETAAQFSLLKDLRIDRVQGFHMGMPVSAELLSAA